MASPSTRTEPSIKSVDPRVWLALICLLALVLRLCESYAWNEAHANSPARLLGDEPGYDNLARSLLEGRGFDWPGRVPGYPVWIAISHLLTGYDYNALIYAQAVLGTAAVALTYLLGRQLFNPMVGLLSAFGAAVDIVLINQSNRVHSEILYTPLLLAAIMALVSAVRRPGCARFAFAGATLAIGALVRPMLCFFPAIAIVPFLMLFKPRKAFQWWLVYLLSALLVLSPWIAYTTMRWGKLFPLQTSNAILWQGSPEYFHLVRDRNFSYDKVWREVIYGPGWEEHDPTSVEGDQWWTDRALRSIESEPRTYLRFAVEKTATYWVGDPTADWAQANVFNYSRLREIGYSRIDAIGAMAARILPLFALIAIAVLWPRRRDLLPVYAILAFATALAAATHAEARLSEPFQPVLIVLVAAGFMQLWRTHFARPAGARKHHRRRF